MTELQVEELMQSGFAREEALQALHLSTNNDKQNVALHLSDYMKQIESDMLELNKFSNEYNQMIECKIKTIRNESLQLQQLIEKKEEQLLKSIENNRNILKSKLSQTKQNYIKLTSRLQTIKQSMDTGTIHHNQTHHDLSEIKQELNATSKHNAKYAQYMNRNHLKINQHWNRIKDDIILTDFMDTNDHEEKKQNNDDDDDDILSIDIMTFNVRNSLLDKQWSRLWQQNRRKLTARMLSEYGPPTVIATQEGVINQLMDIQYDLPSHYMSIGCGRLHKQWYNSSSDRMNEHCTIFWNNDILQIIDYGTFQLKRPQNAPLLRVVTWSLYEFDAKYNIKYGLLMVNTHLSYKTEQIRMVQLEHLMTFVLEMMNNYQSLYPTKLYDKELLIFIVGDFNSVNEKGSQLYDYLFDECVVDGIKIVEHFVDCTKYCNFNCSFTCHLFEGMDYRNKSNFIDWILCSKNVINSEAIRLKRIEVITELEFDAGLPSDHYPVVLKFDIDTTKCEAQKKSECGLQ